MTPANDNYISAAEAMLLLRWRNGFMAAVGNCGVVVTDHKTRELFETLINETNEKLKGIELYDAGTIGRCD